MMRSLGSVTAVALALVAAFWLGDCRGYGRAGDEASAVVDTLLVERVRVDSAYRRDTVRLTRWLAQWDTVRVRDTLVVDSVVYVPRDPADSTIRACRAALSSCDRLRLINDSLAKLIRPPDPRLRPYVAGGYDLLAKVPAMRAGAELRLTRNWSLAVDVEQRLTRGDTARVAVWVRRAF